MMSSTVFKVNFLVPAGFLIKKTHLKICHQISFINSTLNIKISAKLLDYPLQKLLYVFN